MAGTPKKWAQKVDLDEGSLKALGWPNAKAIESSVASGKVTYQKAVQKLGYLANAAKDPSTKKRARSIMVRLKSRFGNKKK